MKTETETTASNIETTVNEAHITYLQAMMAYELSAKRDVAEATAKLQSIRQERKKAQQSAKDRLRAVTPRRRRRS